MTPAYAVKLGLISKKISVKTQKIDGLSFVTYGMALAGFFLQNYLRRIWFFNKTFLLVNTNIEVVLRMFFILLNNRDFQFDIRKFIWRSYTTIEVIPTTSWVELIDKREFAKVALDKNLKTVIIYITTLKATEVAEITIYPSWAAQQVTLQ